MRNFIHHLKAAWLFGKYFPYIEEVDEAEYWLPADEEWLAGVFNSYPGRKLQKRLNNQATKAAVSAVKQSGNHTYNSGVAAGIHMGIASIAAHFPQQRAVREEQSEAIEIFEQAESTL